METLGNGEIVQEGIVYYEDPTKHGKQQVLIKAL